jgi:hypothetical protein
MKGIDWKFKFEGHNPCTGKEVSQDNAMIFKASDGCLPDLLVHYISLLTLRGASVEQLRAVSLLRDRVIRWQHANLREVKTPDLNQCEIDAGLTGEGKKEGSK